MELVDVYCFGQLVYEMSFGVQLNAPTCEELPQSCPATVSESLSLRYHPFDQEQIAMSVFLLPIFCNVV